MSASTGDSHGEPTPVTIRLDADQYKVAAANPREIEWTVAATFLLGLAGFAGFGAAYWVNASNAWFGGTLGLGFLGLGVGMVAWGKYLMPRGPFSESRHSMVPSQAEKDRIITDFSSRGKVVVERRVFLTKILGAAGAVFGVVVMFPLIRSLGPLPKGFSVASTWHKDSPLVKIDGTKVHLDDVEYGGMLTVFPEGDAGGAFSQTMLVRQLPPKGEVNIVTAPAGRPGDRSAIWPSRRCARTPGALSASTKSHPPDALPVPPVALRRRTEQAPPYRSSAPPRVRSLSSALRRCGRVPAGAGTLRRAGRAGLLGARRRD